MRSVKKLRLSRRALIRGAFGTAIARGALGGSIVGVVLASAALATPTMQHRFATSAGFIGGLAAMGALGGAGFATVRAFNHD